jgi:hypothetical protein
MRFIKVAIFVLVYALSAQLASANLLISPQRLFFEPRERVKEMVLLNTGSEELTYRVEWVELKQTATGGYEPIAENDRNSGVKKASEHIRFSPRQVKLRPGENQKVKFVVRRAPNMETGEYRSHLKFVALPRAPRELHQEGETAFDLQVLTSFVVPIILREGNGGASFNIDNVTVTENTSNSSQYGNVFIDWSRQGEFGAVGKLAVFFKPKGEQDFENIGEVNGVNFFAEREQLRSNIILTEAPSKKEGTLKIQFMDLYTRSNEILAERDFELTLP